ncbi:factor-independent urate hydroxylase [Paenibacillus sp. FSL H7-0331]|uniref:factor-independent urate hydroxylase n=1 Tax=Paenibacillus sp. FSL H7-0331 TaxID=1920421 RepID=UPI00096EFA59|nr:urate oxidase [Paenibacillus sp. FSL H7-0331]OMF18253.1 uricase [Paenibacillus sp. FSL H7-0331]
MTLFSIKQINTMNRDAFMSTLGSIFEHSPWVAERVYAYRPFKESNHLHRTMLEAVYLAHRDEQLSLLRAHPDLAGRLQMSDASVQEQRGAGLTDLTQEELAAFTACNTEYTDKFGFPFIMAVKGSTKDQILAAMQLRIHNDTETELRQALLEIAKITKFRIQDIIQSEGGGGIKKSDKKRTMYYGKGDVLVYRTYVLPLKVKPIPESAYTGSDNVIFALNIKVAVSGDAFLTSFTEGDNSMVVATDSMKNFILRHAAGFEGSTVEGFLHYIAARFLATYSHMQGIDLLAERLPFDSVQVPGADGKLTESGLVYRQSRNESGVFALQLERSETGIELVKQTAVMSNLHLIKVSGSSFANFIRDDYTTLPESFNRPLFIYLNIGWTYVDPEDAKAGDDHRYVAPEQISDIAHTVFHQETSSSIQSLIYHIGLKILERFPQLEQVWFESNNRTWETVIDSISGSEGQVYTEPRPPYGFQGFSMTQEDLIEARKKTLTTEEFTR